MFFLFLTDTFYIDLRELKKRDFIFIFIFLSGMLFTVFQYVVLTEEEVPHRKIELAKKAKSDTDSSGNDDNSTDEETANEENTLGNDDSMKGFCENLSLDFYYSGVLYYHHTKSISYSRLTESITTPPPKI